MPTPRFAAVLLFALPCFTLCHAAANGAEHSAPAAPPIMASLDVPFEFIPSVPNTTAVHTVSSGVVGSLPDDPDDAGLGEQLFLPRALRRFTIEGALPPDAAPVNTTEPSFDDPSMMSMVASSPIGPAARRIRADRFNTDDGVMDDFAICYRLNARSSIQVIPGDPAPVKLPVVNIKNNSGVTVGMVVRLARNVR